MAFVLNPATAPISLVDVRTQKELPRIPALHMALTPDHQYLLVGDTTGNAVIFLDRKTGELRKRVVISDPYQLVFSPDGSMANIIVVGLRRNQIDIYEWPA